MGLFDDLIPASKPAASAAGTGLFDDLIPSQGGGLFDDLIPKNERIPERQAIEQYDAATTRAERAANDLQRGKLTFLQALTAAMLRSDDPVTPHFNPMLEDYAQFEARRATPEQIAETKRDLATALVERGKEIESIPRRPVMEQLGKAETFGEAIKTIGRDPIGAIAGATLESLPSVAPALVAGAVNPALGVAAMGGTSAFQELNQGVLEFINRKGIDLSSPEAVRAAFENPELMAEAERYGLTRGAIIGTIDALSAGLASKTLVPKQLITKPLAREAANIPAQVVAQGAAGGGGEAAAQLATEGKITNPGDIVAEVVGEAGGAPVEVASLGSRHIAESLRQVAQQRREQRLLKAIRDALAEEDAMAAPEPTVEPPAPVNTQAQPAAEAAPSDSSPVAAEGTVSGVVNPTAPAQAAQASPPAQTPQGIAPTLRERAQKALRDITELARRKKEWVFDLELRSGDEDRWLARYATKYMDELPEDTQQFLFGRSAFDQETGATHRIGIVDENDDMGSDGEVHGAHIFNLRMLAEDDTENSNTPSALEEVRELVTPATVEQPNAGQQPLSGPEVEAIPGHVEAGADAVEAGAIEPGGLQAATVEARRRGKNQKGPLSEYAERPVGRSFYTRVFEEAGLNPAEAELLPADQQLEIIGNELKRKYGFRAINKESGHNYREAIDAALDAHQNLQSMAAALNLPMKAMSLNGRIDLAFTKGGDGALAWHMGLGKRGSLIGVSRRNHAYAHEWMHALDHELLQRSGARNADLITGRLFTGKLRRGLDVSRTEPQIVEAVANVLHAMYKDDAAKAALVRTLELRLEAAKDPKEIAQIKKQLAAVRRNQPPESSFYQGAVALDKRRYQTPESGSDKGYWQRPTEMWARAGEAYIARNIERMGGGTQFVALPDNTYSKESVDFFNKAYPQRADRERIFAAFDELFGVLQNLQVFGTEKPPAPNTDNVTFDNMDPRLWKSSEKADPFAGMPYYKRLIGELSRLVKDEAAATKRDADEIRARLRNTKEALDEPMMRYIKRILASSVYSGRGALLFLKEVYPHSAAIDELFRKLITRPGTGEFTGRTYEEAVNLYVGQKGNVFQRIVHKYDLGKLNEQELRALRDLLAGTRTTGTTQLLNAARDIGFLLDQIWYDVEQAGIDIGYTKENYLPRLYDHAAIERDPRGFITKATQVYELMFDDITDPAERTAKAHKAAQDWLARIRTGPLDNFDRNGIASSMTANRKLPAEADSLLADFMIRDPLELVQTYILQAGRRIAWAERFGADNKGLTAIKEQMAREGLRSQDIQLAEHVIEIATGQRKSELARPLQAFLAWVHAIGTVALLPRAVLSSLAEPATAGLRSGDVRDSFRAFARTTATIARTENGRYQREMAEFLGVISDTLTDQLLANRFGGTFTDPQGATRLLGRFFHRTGLHAMTNAQRAGIIPLADAYMRSWARRLLEHKGTAASSVLAELGINPSQAVPFSEWLLSLNKRPSIEELESAPPLMRELYTTAINRFIDETIQNPKAVDRPIMAHNPFGRLIFGITSFLWAFQRNVILRTYNLFKAAFTGKYGGHQLTLQERMTSFSLGLIPPICTLIGLHFAVSIAREALFNPDRFEDQGDDFWDRALSGESILLGLSRAGVFGALDPILNAYTGLRYQRDLANVMIGAVPGYLLQAVQRITAPLARNSAKTNTAEFNQLKGLYQLAVAPTLNVALSWAPGGPLLTPAYGGIMMTLSSPNAANEFAEAIVGEKGSKTPDTRVKVLRPESTDTRIKIKTK